MAFLFSKWPSCSANGLLVQESEVGSYLFLMKKSLGVSALDLSVVYEPQKLGPYTLPHPSVTAACKQLNEIHIPFLVIQNDHYVELPVTRMPMHYLCESNDRSRHNGNDRMKSTSTPPPPTLAWILLV